MDGKFRAREVIEEKTFEIEKQLISRSVKGLDEILFGITWTLSRKPETFPQVPGLDLYLAKTDATPRFPSLSIWFTFDDRCVRLLFIEKSVDSD